VVTGVRPIEPVGLSSVIAIAAIAAANWDTNDRNEQKRDDSDQSRNSKKKFTCADAAKENGRVVATGINVTAVLGLGWAVTRGRWRNLSTGTTGRFTTYGFAAGLEASVGVTNMEYDSLGTLTGWSDGWSAGISLPTGVLPFSIGFSVQGASNDAGNGNGGFTGVAPKEGFPSAGASGNFTETNISQCKAGTR
jgi:hypothetical protein